MSDTSIHRLRYFGEEKGRCVDAGHWAPHEIADSLSRLYCLPILHRGCARLLAEEDERSSMRVLQYWSAPTSPALVAISQTFSNLAHSPALSRTG